MSSVWYMGRAKKRSISIAEWAAAGVTAAADTVWDASNGFSIPSANLSAAQITVLSGLNEFNTTAPDGPRTQPAVEEDSSPATKGFVSNKIAASAASLRSEVNSTFAPKVQAGSIDPNAALATVAATPDPRITTPDGSSDVTHPSVVRVPGGWNGHEYWLAITPMPGTDSTKENPCIYYSDDGLTWTAPAGLTNPIEPHPGGADYNSDTHLVLDGNTMRCFFRHQIGGTNYYVCRSSTNGVDWSQREVVYTGTLTAVSYYSACFSKAEDGTWHMHAVNGVPNPNTIEHLTAPAYTGPWSSATVMPVTPPLPAGREAWHIDVHPYGTEWHAVLMDNDINSSGGRGDLYFLTGTASAWRRGTAPLLPRRGGSWDRWYRSCIIPSQRNGRFAYDAWFASFGWRRGLNRGAIEFSPGREVEELRHAREMATAKAGITPYVVADTFNRADGALGNAETGQAWTANNGAPVIAAGQAHPSTDANTVATVNAGIADAYAEMSIPALASSQTVYLQFRRVDGSNFWRVGSGGGVLVLQKLVAGVLTNLIPVSPAVTLQFGGGISNETPLRLGVKCSGSTITLYVNGVQYLEPFTDSALSNGTIYGWQAEKMTTYVDDFLVRRLTAGE